MKLTSTYRKLTKNTTINDETLLSTDYLNHFNELVMMLEMVPDMPEMLAEAEAWVPKTYQEHFRDSNFQHKELAVWAYEQAPDKYRVPLDDCIERMDTEIAERLTELRVLVDGEQAAVLQETVATTAGLLRRRIDTMSALINGAMDAEAYEAEMAAEGPTDHGGSVMGQSDIDALFD
ncbi:MAG: hypothetical protein RIM33_00225 [Alphaproteobacteria bacterium]